MENPAPLGNQPCSSNCASANLCHPEYLSAKPRRARPPGCWSRCLTSPSRCSGTSSATGQPAGMCVPVPAIGVVAGRLPGSASWAWVPSRTRPNGGPCSPGGSTWRAVPGRLSASSSRTPGLPRSAAPRRRRDRRARAHPPVAAPRGTGAPRPVIARRRRMPQLQGLRGALLGPRRASTFVLSVSIPVQCARPCRQPSPPRARAPEPPSPIG